jgi:multidrug efflux pump subunit AcrB
MSNTIPPTQHGNHQGGIIGWFARNSVAANLLMFLVIVLGALQVNSLRKEAFPSMEPDKLTISVQYRSGSAKQSEEGVAIKIEDQLEDVLGIKSISSNATINGATVTVEKQSDYDLDILLRDVRAKVDSISNFPVDAKNPVIKKAQREEHSLWIQLYGDTDRHTLQQLADALKSDLTADDNISLATISGWLDPMMVIEVDEGRLQAYGLSLSDVETAINQGSSTPLSATLKNKHLYLQLKASEQAYLQQDFADIPLITNNAGDFVTLGDVTTITDTFDDNSAVLSRFQGHESIAIQVITSGKDDISDTVTAARKVIEKWQESGRLPKNVTLDSWYDRSTRITERLQLLVKNAITGIALVFVLLALFLNLRVAFWVAMGLPFIVFGTLYFMGDQYVGLSLNEFTTFGFIMALGIVVDDAVVVGESIYSERRAKGDSIQSTVRGTMRVAIPTMFGVFTTVVAFVALSQIEGRLGMLYGQFAAVISICLVLSVIESKLILPAHLAHLNTHPQPSRFKIAQWWQQCQGACDTGLQWFKLRIYSPVIDFALIHRYAVAVLFIGLFVAVISMPLTGVVRMSFFPDIPGDTVRAQLAMQTDASFGQTHDTLNKLEVSAYATDATLRNNKGESGIANIQVLSESDQAGTITVELSKQAPYNINQFTKHWQQSVGQPEAVRSLSIQNTPRMVDALRVELSSNDEALLSAGGGWLKKELIKLPGVSGLEDNMEPGQPQLQLELTPQGRALGMTTEALATQVLQAFSGQVVQRYQRNSDEIEVKVRYPEVSRQTATDVLNADVRTPSGSVIPLADVATATFGYTRDNIERIDRKRAVYLSADVDKQVMSATELVNNVKENLLPQLLRQYPGLDVHFAGEAEEQAETQTSMVKMFFVAMLAIYILLAVPLKSYSQPILIMTAIPFGIVGAILGHWLNDLSLGILSFNGIIALSGVVVNDSLLLVSRFNELREEEPDMSLHDTIVLTCQSRMRAVLLTSFTTYAGLMPLLSETSLQAQFLIPAAVSLGYGIMFATVITLIMIPALLMIQDDVSRNWQYCLQSFIPAKVADERGV